MRLLLTFFFCFLSLILFSQEIRFHRLFVEDGLPSNVVLCLYQDSHGFIWVGTKEGLARYDGHHILPVNMPFNGNNMISDLRIKSICEDHSDNLWIGTDYGVFKYNLEFGTFSHYDLDLDNSLNLSRIVNSIVVSPKGLIWAGTRNGIFFYNESKDRFENYPHFAHHKKYLSISKSERIVNTIFFDRLGYLWIGSGGNGITRLNLEDNSKKIFVNNPLDKNSVSSNFINAIFEDSFGILWFATTNGIARFNREDEEFLNFLKNEDGTGLSDNIVSSIMEDEAGNLFIGTQEGLDYFNRRQNRFTYYQNHPEKDSSISSNTISCCLKDNTGAYWVGTMQGMNSFSKHEYSFELHRAIPGNLNSLSENALRAIVEDNEGMIWIGTQNKGVNRYEISTNSFTLFTSNDVHRNQILTGFTNRKGEVFFGTTGGMIKFNHKKECFEEFDFQGKYKFSKGVYTFTEDADNNYWFTELDRGMFKYDSKLDSVSHVDLKMPGKGDSFTKNIKVLHFDKNGRLWFSIHLGGLGIYDPETEITNLLEFGDKGLETIQIWDIYEDHRGIWLGSENGLFHYTYEDDRFINYNVSHGLPGNLVVSILKDDSGRLWLGTNKGLSCFYPEAKTFINYNSPDGLQGEIFEYKVKLKSGKYLIFGGNHGFNVFKPELFGLNEYVPIPRFTNLTISNHLVKTGEKVGFNVPLENDMSFGKSISLIDTYSNIEFEFSAFSYVDAPKNRYKYQFSGANDTSWVYLEGNKNSISFPLFKPGVYQLKVMASNNDGLWSKTPALIDIHVSRNYRSILGYISNVFLVLIIIWMLFIYRKSLRKAIVRMGRNEKSRATYMNEPYPHFKLDPNLSPRIKKDLQALIDSMEKERLFLDKQLTKNQLMSHLKISLPHLTMLLKDHLNVGFNDFVNYYRVEAVKKMLDDPKNRDYTLLAVSEDCGFNSKTSFYRIFKKFTGKTPAEYQEV
ncbi:helix-turn-helix domain-containing protein [Labilibacter sediminis]|nr:helix-turn-helix domain-containing protein [Labilibacter sediminis]